MSLKELLGFLFCFEKSIHEVVFRVVVWEWFCTVIDKVKRKTEGLMPAVYTLST